MADTTKLILEIETLLSGLNKTLAGIDQLKRKLESVGQVKGGGSAAQSQATAATQRLTNAQAKLEAQQARLELQKRRLAVQTQNVTNAEGRAALAAERLAAAQQKASGATQTLHASSLQLNQILGRVGGSLRNLGLGLTSLGSSLSLALTAPLTALGVLATRNAVTLDSLKRGLTAITGSADEAGVQLGRLTQIAKLPGIGFQEAIQGSIRLQAVGFSAEKAEKALIQFSNAVALTGGGREELDRITVQLGQLSAKGKVLSQDLKPIIEAGPAVGRALKEAFGTVNAEDIQALGLTSEQFLDQLVSQLEKLPRAAAGAKNTFDNFADAVFRASSAIGDAIIPVLTQLINIAEPIITQIANGFKSLPPVLQTVTVAFAGLLAGIGPTLFIIGQLTTGIGGVISGFGRMLGLLQTLLPAINATTAALTAQQAAAAGAAAALGGIGLAIAGVVAITGLLILLSRTQKEAVKISQEQIAVTNQRIDALQRELKFIDGLKSGVARTADEQDRLADIYANLNAQAKIRVTTITDEEKRLAALRAELQRLLVLRNDERVQQAANLAASLADTTAQIEAGDRSRESIAARIKANTDLAESIQRAGKITREDAIALAQQGITAAGTEAAIFDLNKANERLIDRQTELIAKSKELNGTAEEQGQALVTLQKQTGLSARELLGAAKAMGVFKGNIDEAVGQLDKFIVTENRATTSTDAFLAALQQQSQELIKAGDAADAAQKRRKALIDSAANLAKEASTSFKGALQFMRAFIAAQPELAAAIQKELQLQQKSMDEFLRDLLEPKGNRGAEKLRNAQEQLANALLGVQQAADEKTAAQQKATNEELLQGNELLFKRQLLAYRQYLETRATLTNQNIDAEIIATQAAAAKAREAQVRLLADAKKAGISNAERVKRQAQAAEQEEKAIKAEAKVIELQGERAKVDRELGEALAENAIQQLKDIRQLEIEYAELQGRIEDAFKARNLEEFRTQLEALGREQKFLNEEINAARKAGNADRLRQLELERQQNQRQIDSINNAIAAKDALAQLAAAEQLVTNAKERQQRLESDLAFQVEFRGLKEEDAIKQRLDGEGRLRASLELSKSIVEELIASFTGLGRTPPVALQKFIEGLTVELKGLGELSLSEQFRLAQKEFDRLNDERLNRIADVERAVRERDIAEAEGLLLIRRINGQYAADLEQQVALLKQIATASNDANLQRQAAQAEQTTKDATAQFADFNTQLRSTSIDALQSSFADFFRGVRDNTKTAQEKLLALVDSVVAKIEDVIAENLSRDLIESLFGVDQNQIGGIIGRIGRFFGFGGGGGKGGIADAAGKVTEGTTAATTLQTGATLAATTLQTGATTAAATQTASSITFATAVTTAATAFAGIITAAAGAAAALLTAGGAAGGLGSAGGGLAGLIGGAAKGDIVSPVDGGRVIRVAEGGHTEAVLTTDPRFAARQLQILKSYLYQTKGLYGRIQGFAEGGIVSPRQAEANLLSQFSRQPLTVSANIADLPVAAAGGSSLKLRQVLVDKRSMGDWLNDPEADRVLVDWLVKQRPIIRRLSGN
jgi:tape measure domain-containing protein